MNRELQAGAQTAATVRLNQPASAENIFHSLFVFLQENYVYLFIL